MTEYSEDTGYATCPQCGHETEVGMPGDLNIYVLCEKCQFKLFDDQI